MASFLGLSGKWEGGAEGSSQAKGLQVIGAGLPRCGTSSLQYVLESERFGFGPCMHMNRTIPDTYVSGRIAKAMKETNRERRQKLLREALGNCRSTTDLPGTVFLDDLMDMYPDAKIVLNHRPGAADRRPQAWAKSCNDAFSLMLNPWFYWMVLPIKFLRNAYWVIHNSSDAYVQRGVLEQSNGFGGWLQADFYEKHCAWVRKIAADRGREVLEWDPSMGWGPLCRHLDRPLPEGGESVPFPHRNDTAQMQKIHKSILIMSATAWSAILGVTGTAVWFGLPYAKDFVGNVMGRVR